LQKEFIISTSSPPKLYIFSPAFSYILTSALTLSNATNNINQIARRANETGSIYAADMDEIKARQEEIWVQQKEILRRLNKVLDVAK
jgi:uncharacterized protein related to proFAR isomerase